MKTNTKFFLIFLIIFLVSCNDDSSPANTDYDAILEEYRTINASINGAMAQISTPENSVWQGSEGLSEVSSSRMITSDQPFFITSVTNLLSPQWLFNCMKKSFLIM